jgi:hypothetical protein
MIRINKPMLSAIAGCAAAIASAAIQFPARAVSAHPSVVADSIQVWMNDPITGMPEYDASDYYASDGEGYTTGHVFDHDTEECVGTVLDPTGDGTITDDSGNATGVINPSPAATAAGLVQP